MTNIQYADFDGDSLGLTGSATDNYQNQQEYFASGALTGADGLPPDGAAITSLADFNSYVQALMAKTTEITTEGVSIEANAAEHAVLLGGNGDDVLGGGVGEAVIWGRGGDDQIQGSNGDDTIAPGSGFDRINANGGQDTLSYFDATVGVTVAIREGSVQETGFNTLIAYNFDNITGSTFDDKLTGNANANVIQGGGGLDTVYGGGGDDIINNLLSHGAVFGQAGNDTLLTNGQGDYLDGGAGADRYEFHGLIAARSATLGEIGNGDVVSLDFATAYGASQFTAVEHFDGQMACEVIAKYHAGPDRTVYKFDLDGDGHQDHKIVAKGGHYDYSQFTGVDTSHLTTSAAHDLGGLVT